MDPVFLFLLAPIGGVSAVFVGACLMAHQSDRQD